MKVLGIGCSPRKGGNTDILLGEALAGARENGAEVEQLSIRDLDIKPCDGCFTCTKNGQCKIKDDMYLFYDKMLTADGIIFSVPVYFWAMCGQAKVLMDRTLALRHPYLKLANKVGGLIMVGSRQGLTGAVLPFWFFFISNHMVPTEFVSGFATQVGAVRRDAYAMKASLELGILVVKLIEGGFPRYATELEGLTLYNYVRGKHGVSINPTGADDSYKLYRREGESGSIPYRRKR